MTTSCKVCVVSLYLITWYAVNMLSGEWWGGGHKDKGTLYLLLNVVQQVQDKREDANCPLLNVDWFL